MERTEKRERSDTDNSPDRFGGCPVCGGSDGFLNVGRTHWFVCHKHSTKWCIGSHWFRSSRFDGDVWQENLQLLSKYREVTPVCPEPPKSEKAHELSQAKTLRLGPSREDLIADGELIDVTPVARTAGYDYRTAVTRAVWDACIKEAGPVAGDTEHERLWTLLHALRVTWGNEGPESEEVTYDFGGHMSATAISMPTRVITVLLANEEIPFVTPERDNGGIGKAGVPCHVVEAIQAIVRYLWDDERKHRLEADPKSETGHMFTSLVTIRNWLDGDTRTVDSWVKEE